MPAAVHREFQTAYVAVHNLIPEDAETSDVESRGGGADESANESDTSDGYEKEETVSKKKKLTSSPRKRKSRDAGEEEVETDLWDVYTDIDSDAGIYWPTLYTNV